MTVSDDIQLNDPQTLYRRWEDSQWSPFAIDLTADAREWDAMDQSDRALIYWVLASLMVAEERITTKFSGLVGAHGSEEEATFLSTQQVDEARHMQFYARYQDEVVADPAGIGDHVARARKQLSPAFEAIFDGALVQAHEQLVAAPADLAAKTRFVTIYHLILESTLGLTTFRFVTGHLTREQQLAGFVEGYSKIHHDETRHIGYGIWFLRETVRDSPRTGRHRPPDAARTAALGGRIARAPGGRELDRLRCPRRQHRRGTRIRARRPDAPAEHHRRAARHALTDGAEVSARRRA